MPIRLLLAALAFSPLLAVAQTPSRPHVVMNLAAHPDDEDGLTLAYYRGHTDAAVVSVIYTRGEGGQNEAGPDLYERLGAVRTGETEAAARVLGSHVLFLNLYDFGFSKHAAEAFDEWSRPRTGFWDTANPRVGAAAGRDLVTARLVEQIRRYRPTVLFTNHDTLTAWPDAQHGQHQAVGISAVDAFRLAADPGYHPEQLDLPGVELWQPARLFVRQRARTPRTVVALPVRDACAATAVRPAEACADRAVAAAALHVSQGFDKFAGQFREDTTYFELYAAVPGTPAVTPGATDLLAGLLPVFSDSDPLPVTARIDLGSAPLAGITAEPAVVVPGERVRLAWTPRPGRLRLPAALPGGSAQTLDLAAGRGSFVVPPAVRPTLPRHVQMYDRTESTPPLTYTATDASGRFVAVGYVPVETAPHVALDLSAAPVRLVPGRNEIPVTVLAYDPAVDSVSVVVTVTDAQRVPVAYTTLRAAASASPLVAVIELPEDAAPGVYRVAAEERSIPGCGSVWERVERPAAVLPDVRVAPGLRVGLVRSYDDTTERALQAMGARVTRLDSAALAAGDFSAFDTVVLDIRAFLVRGDLRAHREALWNWVRGGGHVVIGYHKTAEWNPGPDSGAPEGGWTPIPLALGRDRVTEEDAVVTLLAADSPVFSFPHRITAADWDGWVQERGLYFPTETADARWERLVSLSDTGESALTTGLVVARVGEGTVAYSALGWYRQLEALTPGAWRVFANLVSLPLAAP
ncbi:MAG TPA: PIG-L family deacetylase [Rubricoccaceae bacterium]|jgi:LmbE family N-acetylglucosaminyl deacetylase